jgi:hypothetical protein
MGSLAVFDNHYIDSASKDHSNEEGIHFIGAVMEDKVGHLAI